MSQPYEVKIDKLVHGGQGLATLNDGKKALLWNVLPGEKVRFFAGRKKSSYVEGIANEIVKASTRREQPRDKLYLSTSPWQMMAYEAENSYKPEILVETLQRAGVVYDSEIDFYAPDDPWHYRNKMEYSFYGDEDGVHLALYNRGTHQKQIVTGSSIARPEIDRAADRVCRVLESHNVRAGDLKSLIVRCNKAGQCVAALFTRNEKIIKIAELDGICQGLTVYFSNPKSPASVLTRRLFGFGETLLSDELLGRSIKYDAASFFQVNLEPYETALQEIKHAVSCREVTDMYAGVGSIGLSVAQNSLRMIEIDVRSAEMAEINAASFKGAQVIQAASEKSIEYIPGGKNKAVVFDPPRAGLHAKVVGAVLENRPEQVIYLSCNPSTLGRDLNLLQKGYSIKHISGYNFFPRTPHIETLAILETKI